MTKPDPTLTAHLLSGLLPKPNTGASAAPVQASRAERHPAPVAHKPKQAPIKSTAGHTRTSNRGK